MEEWTAMGDVKGAEGIELGECVYAEQGRERSKQLIMKPSVR